jgi:hypothetical protein
MNSDKSPREEEMAAGHAAHELLHAMDRWDGQTRMALFVLLIAAMNAIDRPDDQAYVVHARECLLDVLQCVPGLVEQGPPTT